MRLPLPAGSALARILLGSVLLGLAAGCSLHPAVRSSAASATADGGTSVAELAAQIKAAAAKSDHETDSGARGELAAQADQAATACLAQAPQDAACLYGRALASGLEARVHPTRANELLKGMLDNLGRAAAVQPDYDEAGPARVRALVLLKSPPWPLGPGDAEEGLKAAQQAVALRPAWPPNQLALALAQAKNGDSTAAGTTYAHARDLAQAMPPSPERDDWLHEADAGQHTH